MASSRQIPEPGRRAGDRSVVWLRFAAAGLGLLAGIAAAVSFAAQSCRRSPTPWPPTP